MPDTSRPITLVISVFTACVCVSLVFLLSLVGGLLNRGRGGYIHFGPANSSSPEGQEWYWPAHVLSRLLFAVPTGIVVVSKAIAYFCAIEVPPPSIMARVTFSPLAMQAKHSGQRIPILCLQWTAITRSQNMTFVAMETPMLVAM